MVVEGAVLLQEAASGGWHIDAQILAPGGEALAGVGDDLWFLADGVLERISDTATPQPVLGLVERRTRQLADLAAQGWILVADQVSDPGNMGTLIRSAEVAGAVGVVITKGSVDWSSPKTVRSSAGAIFHVPIVEVESVQDVRDMGWKIVATSSHEKPNAVSFRDVDLRGRVALVVGNEAHGLDGSFKADVWVTIPHVGRAESLNVAMAGTLIAFEIAHQNRSGPQ